MTRILLALAALLAFAGAAHGTATTLPGFTARVNNPWFPLRPGSVYTYRGIKDGQASREVMTVTHSTTKIGGYPAGRTSMDLPIARAITKAVSDASGGAIVRLPTLGGSAPFYLFSDVLQVPTIGLSIVNFDNNQHGPNENVRIKNIWDGMETMAAILTMP